MLFVIHCLDRSDALPTRLDHYDSHKAYLSSASVGIVISGPLLADDGETMIGSFFLVEAADRVAVDGFHQSDPFFHAGVWERVEIHPFHKRIDSRN